MAALIEPDDPRKTSRWTSALNRVQAKRVDFIAAGSSGAVLGVIELDDRTHNVAKDKARDQLLLSAGLRVLRWSSREKPNEETITSRVLVDTPAVEKDQKRGRSEPGTTRSGKTGK